MELSYITILFLYLLIVVLTIRKTLLQVSNPAKTLSWIMVIVFMPVFGLLLFKIIGRNIRKDKKSLQIQPFYNSTNHPIKMDLLPSNKRRLVSLLDQNLSSGISYNNEVLVIKNGEATFNSILLDFEKAKRTIHLDFYIIEGGKIFSNFKEVFKLKIKEGVKIRLVYDAFGTGRKNNSLINELEAIGVETKVYMPFNFLTSLSYLNYRNHRKIVIIDSQIAYTGGMNISDKHISSQNTLGLWRDTFVKIVGLAALDFEKVFNSDWAHAGGSLIEIETKQETSDEGGVPVQVIASGPDSPFHGILHEYFTIITDAEDYVYISTPYFVPGESILMALKTAALSGIDVRLMMPYNSDSKWMRWCMFTYLEDLLAAGVKIYLYHKGFLHNKVFISDDIISSIGTANVDERSFETNFEINAIIYDRKTTLDLKSHFFEDIASCELLSLEHFQSRPDRNKIMEAVARLTSPIL